jgi:hypothetical protein
MFLIDRWGSTCQMIDSAAASIVKAHMVRAANLAHEFREARVLLSFRDLAASILAKTADAQFAYKTLPTFPLGR